MGYTGEGVLLMAACSGTRLPMGLLGLTTRKAMPFLATPTSSYPVAVTKPPGEHLAFGRPKEVIA